MHLSPVFVRSLVRFAAFFRCVAFSGFLIAYSAVGRVSDFHAVYATRERLTFRSHSLPPLPARGELGFFDVG